MQVQARTYRWGVTRLFEPRNFAIFIGVLLGIAYLPILLGKETLCYRDFGVMGIPTATYHRAAFWAGEIPLWNPYSNCGVPFLAQWGTMVLYPPTLLYVLLPMPWALNVFCIGHLWLGAIGMYLLARQWKMEPWPAAIAGAGFVFCGITQSALSWPNYTAALGLLPWVMLTLERAWEASSWRGPRTFVATVVASLQLLAGVPELAVFTWIIVSFFWLERWMRNPGQRKPLLYTQAFVIAGAAGICAVQLLPFLELLRFSQRTPGFAVEKWALPPWGWVNLILPRFHTFTTPEGTVFQYGQEFLSSTYVGASLALLALLSLRRRNARMIILGALSLTAAVLALGSNAFVYVLAMKVAPFLQIARYPAKFLYILSFTVPMLAALGVQSLPAKAQLRNRVLLLTALAFVVGMAGLIWWNVAHPFRYDRVGEIQENSIIRLAAFLLFTAGLFSLSRVQEHFVRPLQVVLLCFLCLDGATHLPKQNPTVSASIFEPGLWSQSQNVPRPEHGAGRAFITPAGEAKLLHSNVPEVRDDLVGKRLALWSHLNLLDLVPKVNGSATLQLKGQALVQNALYASTNSVLEPWLDFLNVTLMTSSNSVIEWQPRENPMPFITAGQKPVRADTNLLQHPLAFGREVALEPWSPEFDRFTNAVVELSDVTVRSGEVSFTADTDKPTVAVLPVSWHPGWRAEVSPSKGERKRVPVLKANLGFQAVPIPAGHSRVRLVYVDEFFRAGALISILTLLGAGTFCLVKRKRSSQG